MIDAAIKAGQYIGYEHQSLTVSGRMLALYTDNYQYFGWELEEKSRPLPGVNKYLLGFKRNWKIINKVELTRLQRQFDSHIREIERMEQSKFVFASMAAYTIGIIGSAFMAGAVFAYLAGIIPLCIVLAVPGILGWIVPFWCYRFMQKKKAAEVQPFIERKYEELYAVCERAHALSRF